MGKCEGRTPGTKSSDLLARDRRTSNGTFLAASSPVKPAWKRHYEWVECPIRVRVTV